MTTKLSKKEICSVSKVLCLVNDYPILSWRTSMMRPSTSVLLNRSDERGETVRTSNITLTTGQALGLVSWLENKHLA